jgi:hypothetical protein
MNSKVTIPEAVKYPEYTSQFITNRFLIFLSLLGVHHPDPNVRENIDDWVADIKAGELNLITGKYNGT